MADLDDPRIAPAFESTGATPTDLTSDHLPPGADGDPELWAQALLPGTVFVAPDPPPLSGGRPTQPAAPAPLSRLPACATPSAADAYAQIKVALARLHPDDVDAYYDIKDLVCDLIVEAAERWTRQTSWSGS